jgi:hypothetical protein
MDSGNIVPLTSINSFTDKTFSGIGENGRQFTKSILVNHHDGRVIVLNPPNLLPCQIADNNAKAQLRERVNMMKARLRAKLAARQ